MKIYTRTGDSGHTQIYADKAQRVSKDDLILDCYGNIDELNCHIGVLVTQVKEALHSTLHAKQRHLFQIGFAISATTTLTDSDVTALEQEIDTLSATLAPQTRFILPGGSPAAATAHLCRAVCRRAERSLVGLSHEYPVPETVLAYINRLSDYFFTLARHLNVAAGTEDIAL